MIACLPDEPRYIGDQDVFVLQDKVIDHILAAEREAEARAAAPTAVDPIQQTVSEEIKDALRRQTIDRDLTKNCIQFLGQPMGRSLHLKLRKTHEAWCETRDDGSLLAAVRVLSEEFAKERPTSDSTGATRQEDLELICFEYVTG